MAVTFRFYVLPLQCKTATRDAIRKVPVCGVVSRRPPVPLPLCNIGFLGHALQGQEVFPVYESTLGDTIMPCIPAAYRPT